MELDERVRLRYELGDEDARLWKPGGGALVRMRTWNILERVLPAGSRVLDVGGGPGTHAAHLAKLGYSVRLFDPMPRHVERARQRSMSQPEARFEAEQATRYAWLLDAATKGLLADENVWKDIEHSVATGSSLVDPNNVRPGAFWAYFHRVEQLREELTEAGFVDTTLIGVEGCGWLLGDLESRLVDPQPLLRALQLCETEPSMLGVSAHVIGVCTRSATGG